MKAGKNLKENKRLSDCEGNAMWRRNGPVFQRWRGQNVSREGAEAARRFEEKDLLWSQQAKHRISLGLLAS